MTVLQRYFNLESTYRTVTLIAVLAIAVIKITDLKRYVNVVIYHLR